jgi:hypothetical protein
VSKVIASEGGRVMNAVTIMNNYDVCNNYGVCMFVVIIIVLCQNL